MKNNERSKFYNTKEFKDTNILQIYMNDIGNHPFLTDNQVVELFKKKEKGDQNAKEKIFNNFLKLVVFFARKYANNGIDIMDLIQEGNIALLRAIDLYDYKREASFITYAGDCIKCKMLNMISENRFVVRLPRNAANQVSIIRKYVDGYEKAHGTIPSKDKVMKDLKISGRIYDVYESINNYNFVESLDEIINEEADEEFNMINGLEDASIEEADDKIIKDERLKEILEIMPRRLNNKSVEVLKMRLGYYNGKCYTLEEIAKKYHVSRERIRQIEAKALRRIKSVIADISFRKKLNSELAKSSIK